MRIREVCLRGQKYWQEISALEDCRVFRFDEKGNAEYTWLSTLNSRDPAPRWYGHVSKEEHFVKEAQK